MATGARWLGSHVLETIAKKDGQVVGQGTYEVSADGKTLTVSSKDASENAQGWQSEFEQVIVLDRTRKECVRRGPALSPSCESCGG